MRPLRLSVIAMAAGLLMSAPAFAQTSPGADSPNATADQKQHTDGGNSPANPRATDAAAAAWHKQHTDGGDSAADLPPFQKSTVQSYAHGDAPAANGAVTKW